ncbi:virion core protein, T7 gp14 family [Pannonibacter sp. SL95]|uniref:virion core protein, T7 gp14 family n=1 Tax=Pannonibacter sp. SL95 TaxID=2995153 RepID=UPI002272D029|nr:hypothetical protein [Pannonibacter sp. SL95]MCY1708358.1 hypothetical protein [Pannonibacter sp. SL95]
MWNELALSGVGSFIRRGVSFVAAQREAKVRRQWQDYSNKMVRIADAQNQNAITTNQLLAKERSTVQSYDIQRSALVTKAQAEASAAAAGTSGNSVNAVLLEIDRNEAETQARRVRDLNTQLLQGEQQRSNSALQAVQSLDFSPIPMPKATTYALGFTTDLGATYKDYKRGL